VSWMPAREAGLGETQSHSYFLHTCIPILASCQAACMYFRVVCLIRPDVRGAYHAADQPQGKPLLAARPEAPSVHRVHQERKHPHPRQHRQPGMGLLLPAVTKNVAVATSALASQDIIALPTDTLYGIAGDAR